jgi:ethanolamine utilization protein EutQ (cupin superfamily)
MTSKILNRICNSIAAKINRNVRSGGVTREQILRVVSGEERTVSHPVIADIMAELRDAKVKIAP